MRKKVFLLIMVLALIFNAKIYAQFNALHCDGVDDAAWLPFTSPTNDFTVEMWVYPTTTRVNDTEANIGATGTTGQKYVVFPQHGNAWGSGTANAGMGISVGTNGIGVYEHADGYLPCLLNYNATITGWTHIAVVYTNRTPSLYVNGTLVRTGLQSTFTNVHLTNNLCGGNSGSYGNFEGYVDDARYWTTSRSASEIADNQRVTVANNATGLLAYYTFNQGNPCGANTTTLTDYSVNAINATLSGFALNGCTSNFVSSSAPVAMAAPGNSLDFDGTDDFVDCGNINNSLSQMSIEGWVYLNSYGASGNISTLVTKSNLYIFGVADYGNLVLVLGDGSAWTVSSGSAHKVSLNRWTHVAVSWNGTSATYYIDGVFDGTAALSQAPASNTSPMCIGSLQGNYHLTNGKIDEVSIWNTAITQSQVQNNMVNSLVGNESGLLNYYNFDLANAGLDNTNNNLAYDKVSKTYNSTLTNFALTGNTSNFVNSYAMVQPTLTAATSVTSDGFTANWTAPAKGLAPTNYYLDVATDAAFTNFVGSYNNFDCGNVLTYNVVGLTAGTPYYYRVRAYNTTAGTLSSASSNVKTIVTGFEASVGNNALSFDGTDDYVDLGNTLNNATQLSFETWINIPSVGVWKSIISKKNVIFLGISPTGNIHFNTGSGSAWNTGITSTLAIPINTWTLVSVTWDGSSQKIYINGVLDKTTTNTWTYGNNADPLVLGAELVDATHYFIGSMDEFRI